MKYSGMKAQYTVIPSPILDELPDFIPSLPCQYGVEKKGVMAKEWLERSGCALFLRSFVFVGIWGPPAFKMG